MLKKIYNFQKLMLLNIQLPFGNSSMNQKFTDIDKYAVILLLFLGFMYPVILDGSLIFLFLTMIVVIVIGSYLSYNNDIIKIIPASKPFIMFNLYLSGIVYFIISYLFLLLIGALSSGILLLMLFISGGLENSSSSSQVLGIEGSILLLLIILIFYFVMLTIMFIKKQNIRYGLSIGFTCGYYAFLLYFKRIISGNTNKIKTNDMLMSFQNMPNKSTFLFYWISAFIIIALTAIVVSYYLYRGQK